MSSGASAQESTCFTIKLTQGGYAMKKKNKKLFKQCCLSVALILLSAASAIAQDEHAAKPTILSSEAPSLRFEHLGVGEGMAQGSANSMMQDSKGYLWIATQGGLHRYDGYEFKVYTSIPFDTTSLSANWVWGMTEAKNGDIWVTTDGQGLNRLDQATGKFKKYVHDDDDSTSISSNGTFFPFLDSRGDLWVGTIRGGLNRMRAGKEGIFEHYRYDPDNPNSLSSDVLYGISEDSSGSIWVGSTNGVNRIDPETDTVTRFLYEPKAPVNRDGSQSIFRQYPSPDNHHIIWLAGNGLIRLNSETGAHERFLIFPTKNGEPNPLNVIYQVAPDPNNPNILWVGGPGMGVARFDMLTESFTSYQNDPRDPHSLSDDQITSLLTDRSGTMWAGTAGAGLDAFNPGAVNFTHLRNNPENPQSLAPGVVWGIYEDIEGALWVGTNTGIEADYLTRVDGKTGAVTRYRHNDNDSSSLQGGTIRLFAENKTGQFWVGGARGLSRLNRNNGRVTRFSHTGNTREDGRRNTIFALVPTLADSNELWVGSIGGLDRFDTRTGRYTSIPLDSTGTGEDNPPVASLYEDTQSTLWVGTLNGLFSIDSEGHATLASAYDPHDTTTISQNLILSITERAVEPGILWLATQGGGLNRYDTQTGIATHYTTADGLSDNTLYGILNDDSGTLWMSTNKGISNFDPGTKTFRNYGLDDGLMALEYDQNAYAKGKGGVLYFGSAKGVTAFVPEQLHTNEIPPQVIFSDFKLANKSVAIGPDSPLKKPVSEAKTITLKHNQNELTFDFVALHYANPAKNIYAYQLEGFDKDWIEAGNKRTATYTNLSPGNYTFRVKAANADGIWNEQGASVGLSVLPPWYRTWWAYGLFLGILGFMVFGVDRVQRQRLSKKEQERAALREAEIRAEAENKRRSDTEQLSKIGRAITSTLSVHKIIETVYENVNALMDATIFGVGIFNKEQQRLDFPATKEKGKMLPPYGHRLDEENRLAVWCFKNRDEIIIGDFQNEHKRYIKLYKPPIEGEESKSVLYLPLIQQDHVVGVITTQSFQKNAYSEYHINLLRNLATYAAIALDNASAYRQLNATISELQTMQQQLVQQEKLASLGQLTAGIAHEIKNPLNFVNNFSEVSVELIEEVKEELSAIRHQLSVGKSQTAKVESQKFKDAEAGEVKEQAQVLDINYTLGILNDIEVNLHKIHEHGSRADSIVKSMLQHSRGGSGKREATDLNALIKEYVNLSFHGMRAGKKPINVDLDFDLDESIGEVPLIGEDFSRVIVNLSNNAFDAMREKQEASDKLETAENHEPKLAVRTAKKNGQILVEVTDNGPGIPDSLRDKIMQPFFTTKKGTEGTGLGLSITNDVVKIHGGTINIESEQGRFTRFIITIPT